MIQMLHVVGSNNSNYRTNALAASKVHQALVEAYHNAGGIPVQHLTLATVYGPMIDNNNAETTVNNTTATTIYVDDAMAIILKALKYNKGLRS
jgi:nucleoside-diphosphate-sugar epimerase